MAPLFTIATRGSPLALRQAEILRARLIALTGADAAALPMRIIKTSGDRFLASSLQDLGGKGLFTKEIDEALLTGEADIAVHSAKDLPAALPPGLVIAAFLPREDPRDALVSREGLSLAALAAGARIGTASLRRRAQIRRLRPDLEPVLLRGNVGRRLAKCAAGEVDAVVLALAGLKRLGLADRVSEILDPTQMLPAPAQGVIAIVTRADDDRARAVLARIDDPATRIATCAERALAAGLDASCRTPIAALAELREATLSLRARLISPDGSRMWEAAGTAQASAEAATALGSRLAAALRRQAGPAFFAALAAR